ncbi:SIR2 family protein [Desulfoluna sp.]|uniref:SIR2 family protein n=1 Tax=Desulfoluna sp. TaxID=2045199 RepID=UPI002602B8E7|nr:SIR2 family protein [Desulfoluna sp.]
MKPQLTKEIAYKALQNFFTHKPFVLFGTGTSCAVDKNFGMGALEAYLKDEIPKVIQDDTQISEWGKVLEALKDHGDFEASMNSIQDETLLFQVINKTADLVSRVDRKNAYLILNGTIKWPAIGLLQRLVERLPETDRTLHVATPNYDLMAEYAFVKANIPYTTGFWGGVLRKLDWTQAERQMTRPEKMVSGRTKVAYITRVIKHLRLYKVHGSLNTFVHDHQAVETDMWSVVPKGVERLMITPGTSKHEKLLGCRDILLKDYDRAVSAHSAFLFLGFGFNDKQLVDNAIGEKLSSQCSPALIITRDSNPRIEALLKVSPKTWLVCKHPDNDNSSTVIKNSQYMNDLILSDSRLWQFDHFTSEILGG